MTYRLDPPDEDGPDPNRCTCGDEIVPCPAAGDGCLTCLRCDDVEPDSERTRRADYDLDRQRDEALLDRLREERERLERALPPEADDEVPF